VSRPRAAVYTATAVTIDCPHCGEALHSPGDSVFWTVDELALAIEREPSRLCNSCDEPFVLRSQTACQLVLGTGAVSALGGG